MNGSGSLQTTDTASERVRKGFRITLADIEASVADCEYIHRGTLTIAVIQLRNGWYLLGRSAPVDPSNYDEDHGRRLAYDDAIRHAWPLLAFSWLENQKD